MKKALILNASPHRGKGNTARLLEAFSAGLRQAGATVDTVNVYDLDIKPCIACFACWVRTPGKCVQRDDMEMVLDRIRAADIIVLGTPVYVDGMTGSMKMLVDRLIPLIQPFVEVREGRVRHVLRPDSQRPSAVLASMCGFAEPETFDPLIQHVQAVCKNLGWRYAGALTIPGSVRQDSIQKLVKTVTEAAEQVVETGEILRETECEVRRYLMPIDQYVSAFNAEFESWMARVSGSTQTGRS